MGVSLDVWNRVWLPTAFLLVVATVAITAVTATPSAAITPPPTSHVFLPLVATNASASQVSALILADQGFSLGLHNGARSPIGETSLRLDTKLTAVAQSFADSMAAVGYFAHVTPDGRDLARRLTDAGVSYSLIGENLGKGMAGIGDDRQTIQSLFDQMMAETPPNDEHRVNILNPRFGRLGVGVARDAQGNLLWVCDFAD